jgi:hypothetical protein
MVRKVKEKKKPQIPSQVIPDSAQTYFPTKPRKAGIYTPR